MRPLTAAVLLMIPAMSAAAAESTYRADGVTVGYSGIDEAYAIAIARTTAAARQIAAAEFGCDMPDVITIHVTCGPGEKVRLFNDGRDRFELHLESQAQLARPSVSGIFQLYGLCHEVGHLAMYRPIRQHDWMTTAAAEGWAHYLGSRLVDGVYAREGEKLWPDAYDYRADGMARLKRQLAQTNPDDVAAGAGLWMQLAETVGDKGMAPIFRAWGQATVDPADPAAALAKALPAGDKPFAEWWEKAAPSLILKRERSTFVPKTATPAALAGRPSELARDDGAAAGKASLAGGGHAVRLEAPGDAFYATAVAIHGARYGAASGDFHVWLCDADFKAFADFTFPYSSFEAGKAQWVRLPVRPTLVPRTFFVCVGFNPTASQGVFVSRDKESSGDAFTGLPGKGPSPFAQGDWLIRVLVDRAKSAAPARR